MSEAPVFDIDPNELPGVLRAYMEEPAPPAATPAAASCCSTAEQQTCCEAADKDACCGTGATAGCGCQ